MSAEEQALYDAALLLAYALDKGAAVNLHTPAVQALLTAARAAAAADGGKTLRQAAEAV